MHVALKARGHFKPETIWMDACALRGLHSQRLGSKVTSGEIPVRTPASQLPAVSTRMR